MPESEPTFEQPNFFDSDPQGIGVVLTINGATRAMNRFFGNLPASYGNPIDKKNTHVTFLDYEETKIDVYSGRDLITLRNTGDQIAHHLAALSVSREVFKPEGDELEKFGRYLAMPLRNTDFMADLRGRIAEITADNLGVTIDRGFEPHMSVVYSSRGKSRAKEHVPPFPRNLHVNGFDIQRRVFTHNSGGLRADQPYVNKSKSLRRK